MEVLHLLTLPTWLLWIFVVGVAAYWYMTRNHGYWKKHGIPHVPAVPIFGTLRTNFKRPLHEVEVERYQQLGKVYGTYEGNTPVLTVSDPDLLRNILVKDFHAFIGRRNLLFGDRIFDNQLQMQQGEKWKRLRTIVTPTFSTGKIKRMTSIIIDSAKTLTENLLKASKSGTPVDIKSLFGAYVMDVVVSTAFGTKIDSHNNPKNPFVEFAKKATGTTISWRFMAAMVFPSLMRFFRISLHSSDVSGFFRDVTLRIIEERKRTGQKRNDYLQMLMDVAKDDLDEEIKNKKDSENKEEEDDIVANYSHGDNNDQVFKKIYQNKTLSHDELIAQCVLFFMAGYGSTSSTVSLAVYNLAVNPECQEKLIQEIDETVGEGELTYEAIREMKYLDNVISETLRMFPIGIRLERCSDQKYKLEDVNFTIPKGMIVGMPVYAMHHDPQYYPDPEKFDPDRFTPEVKATRHPFTYLPFGAGPRNCVSMRFAIMEIKVALASTLRYLRFRTCPKTKVPVEFFEGQILLVPKEVKLVIEPRMA